MAQSIEWLYTYAPAIGYSNELIHLYVSRELDKLEKPVDEHEISSVEIYTVEEVSRMIQDKKILDSKTLISLALIGALR